MKPGANFATLDVTIDGEDVCALVYWWYQPYERMTHDYPGCPESVELEQVLHGGLDMLALLTKREIDAIEQQILEREE